MSSNIIMMGSQNSGKTTYMVAAYHEYSQGVQNVRISSTNNPYNFGAEWTKLQYGDYPDNTLDCIDDLKYGFKLFYKNEELFEFTWHDYRGGALTRMNDRDHENVVKIITEDTQGLVVFVDGDLFKPENKQKLDDYLRIVNSVLQKLDRHLSKFRVYQDPNRKMHCVLVVTKGDTVQQTSRPDNAMYERLCKSCYIDGSRMSHIEFYGDEFVSIHYDGNRKTEHVSLYNIDKIFAHFLLQLVYAKVDEYARKAKEESRLYDLVPRTSWLPNFMTGEREERSKHYREAKKYEGKKEQLKSIYHILKSIAGINTK